MAPQDIRIADYTYELPDDRIAIHPLEKRDQSRLLISSNGELSEDIYQNIARHIPSGSLMVFNQTKVVHARLLMQKPTGGRIELFCLAPGPAYPDIPTAMMQKGSVLWNCMVGGAAKWKPGVMLELLQDDLTVKAQLAERTQGSFLIRLQWNDPDMTFAELLSAVGKLPLPPYLNRDAEVADEHRYQTVFAKSEGSVAAPTAGLHFTDSVLADIAASGIDTAFVTLHVGAGTFKPVKSETMQGHEMHEEFIDVDFELIEKLATHNTGHLVAVGTTSLRTLESLYWIGVGIRAGHLPDSGSTAVKQWDPYELPGDLSKEDSLRLVLNHLRSIGATRLVTRTQLLIAPGYRFRVVDGLVTNFHQPGSTLLLLVAAFAGTSWRVIYNYALTNGFRFLSFGDGSLIWR